jgi:hypothetical protein
MYLNRFFAKPIGLAAISSLWIYPFVTSRATDVSTTDIDAQIRSVGAQATVRDLWQSPGIWNALLQHVQSGDRAWLKVAADLKSGTDGGQLETLRIAVSQSIQNQPENFLVVAWPVFGDDACHDLRIEPTPQQHADFILKTRQALAGVTTENLRSKRELSARFEPGSIAQIRLSRHLRKTGSEPLPRAANKEAAHSAGKSRSRSLA